MSKHLTPAVDESWNYRLPAEFRRPPEHRIFEFPARPEPSSSRVRTTPPARAGGESSSPGTGLPLRSHPLAERPVPVGHLTLVDRIKRAAEKLDDLEEDCA